MPRVTLVSSPMDGNCGIGTYARSLISGFEDEVNVNVVTLETHSNGLRAIRLYARAAIRAGRTDDDLVHIQHEYGLFGTKWYLLWVFYPLLLLLTQISATPVVITVHEAWNADRVEPPLKPIKTRYIWLANKLIAGTATSIIFLSENCEQKFTTSVPVEDTFQIAHGVYGETVDISESKAKERLGFHPDDVIITELGYVRPSKGYESFLALAEQLPEYEFLVAGGSRGADEYYERIKASAPENVTVTGHLDDDQFHLAFRATDVAVLPYKEVAQSGIFNMCAAYGLPTVTTRLPYFERLETEYSCVLVFDDLEEAERQIKSILTKRSVQEQLTEGLKSFVLESDSETVRSEHIAIYDSISGNAV